MKKILLCSILFVQAVSAADSFPDPGLNVDDLGSAASSSSSNSSGFYEDINVSNSWDALNGEFKKKGKAPRIFIAQIPPYQEQHHTYGPQTINHSKAPVGETFVDAAAQTVANTLFSLLTRDLYEAGRKYVCPSEEDKLNLEFAKLKLRQAQNSEIEREASNQIIVEIGKLTSRIREIRAEASASNGNLSQELKVELESATRSLGLLTALIGK
jgi:hypothetical protein